jgi:predicted aspartyl protease
LGTENYRIADVQLKEETRITLRKITIDSIVLNNVGASIFHNFYASLLLDQSALRRLGKIEFESANNTEI